MATSLKKYKTVYFFGTCLADLAYPDAGMAAIRLLQQAGLEVVFPLGQSCCGQPAYNSGYPEEARQVARAQFKLFEKNDWPIIVPSGSCTGMMRVHYPKLFENDQDYFAIKAFSERVFEFGEFLNDVLEYKPEDKGAPVTVAWHSSCHAKREAECVEASKNLVRQLSNVTLVELEREYECCGFGGTFSIKRPDISSAMVEDKVADIVATGATHLVSGDCGCLMNIGGAMEKKGITIKTQHLAEFILERVKGGN